MDWSLCHHRHKIILTTIPIGSNNNWSFTTIFENVILQVVPDTELSNLGGFLDRDSFDSASIIYNIPVNALVDLKNSYISAATSWYNEEYSYSSSSSFSARVKKVKEKKKVTNYYMPEEGDCEELYRICKENAHIDYLVKMGECYGSAIAIGAGATPIGGGIWMIGCGLLVGRRHTNELKRCTIDYNRCQ